MANFTKSDVITYTYAVVQYELTKYKYDNTVDTRLRNILKQDLERAYERVTKVREALGL
jgi:hypothetical protein